MSDLDPDFAALANPAPAAAPPQQTQGAGELDPDFAALAAAAVPGKSASQSNISGPQFALKALSSYASHPLTSGVGMLENTLSSIGSGAGSLLDAVTGSSPGTYNIAYRPRTEAGQEQAQLAGIASNKVGQAYDATAGTGPLAQTLKERIPEALGATGTLAMLPGIPKGIAGTAKLPFTPMARAVPSAQAASRAGILQAGQDAGYVVPPSTGNPTFLNKLLGGIAGKTKVQQAAQGINRDVLAQNAGQSLNPAKYGLPADTPINQESLPQIRAAAFKKGYVPVRSAGEMSGDETLNNAIDALTQQSRGASRSFPTAFPQNTELANTLSGLKAEKFDSGDAVDAVAELRSRADDAYGSGDATSGRAYKGAANALEDAIQRNLAARGKPAAQMLQDYKDSRTTIAQTYSMGKALTGDELDATKLATQLQNGKPLTGSLKTAAQMASLRQFRPSMSLPNGATEGISPIDVYGSTMGALAAHSVWPLGIPLSRAGIAKYLLSPAGQAGAIPKAFRPTKPVRPTGLLGGAGQASPAIQSLFNTPSQTP